MMFHNSFDGTLPKTQTFVTGQGAQDPQHRWVRTCQTACRAWVCTSCELTLPPAGPCWYKEDISVPSPWKAGVGSPSALLCSPCNTGFWLPTWLRVPGPHWAPLDPCQTLTLSPWAQSIGRQGQAGQAALTGRGRCAPGG